MANWLKVLNTRRLANLSYWKWRSRWLKWQFHIHGQLYAARAFADERNEDVRILKTLIRATVFPFAFSILCLLVLLVLPFPNVTAARAVNYDTFLVAVAAITGVFLSFYFTGLNTVIGGLYAKSPEAVRALLIQERVNHFSVRFLVFLTLLCLELLVAGFLLDNRLISSVVLIAVMGCFAVLFFAQLGRRAFYFFDPSLFARQLGAEILKWAASSTPKGYEFESPEFQDYYRGKCQTALDGFQGLIYLAKTESHLNETLAQIARELQHTYINYLGIKRSIPTKSRWFLYTPVFQNWFTASQTLVQLASATQTNLQPETKPFHEWLEERLEGFCAEVLDLAWQAHSWQAVDVIFYGIFNQFTALGRAGEIGRALSFFAHLQALIGGFLSEPIPYPVNWGDETVRHKLGAVQVLNSLLVTLTAGLFNSLEAIDLNQLRLDISTKDWTRRSAPYNFVLPFRLLPRIEYLRDGMLFELNAEGQTVSPPWYIVELIYQELGFYLKESVELVMAKGVSLLKDKVQQYEDENRLVEASVLASDALEMEAKTRHLVYTAKSLADNIEKERSIKGLRWAEWKWDELEDLLNSFHETMMVAQVSHLAVLFAEEDSSNVPDYFGKAVVFAGEECIKSLASNDGNLFRKLFEKYFAGILLTYEKLRSKGSDLGPEQFALLLTEPIMDLLDISGYAWLYSEYHQNPALWEPCRATWDKAATGMERQFLETLALLVRIKIQTFGITNRDQSRSRWTMILNDRLRSLPRKYGHEGLISEHRSHADHPSKLVRLIAGYDAFPLSMYQPHEIFIDLYLSRIPEAKGLDFGIRYKVSDAMSEGELD